MHGFLHNAMIQVYVSNKTVHMLLIALAQGGHSKFNVKFQYIQVHFQHNLGFSSTSHAIMGRNFCGKVVSCEIKFSRKN